MLSEKHKKYRLSEAQRRVKFAAKRLNLTQVTVNPALTDLLARCFTTCRTVPDNRLGVSDPADGIGKRGEIQPTAVKAQLERILSSQEFAASNSLQDFLSYSVQEVLAGRGDEIKEHSIAVSVFGRKESFDGRDDTIVRVQAHRLRSKLKEYYSGTGASDELLISLPRGNYSTQFDYRHPASQTAAPTPQEAPDRTQRIIKRDANSAAKSVVIGGMLLAAGIAIGAWAATNFMPNRHPSAGASISPSVRQLWAPLLQDEASSTLIVYSPTVFLSNSAALLRYQGPYTGPTDTPISNATELVAPFVDTQALQALGPLVFNHSWGSAGTPAQVHHLTKLFSADGREVSLRSSVRLDRDAVGDRNVVILESRTMEDIWSRPPYTFERPDSQRKIVHQQPQFARIRNHFPGDGEPEYYEVEHRQDTLAREFDYGLFAILPGVTSSARIAVCAGMTTFGGWGVAEFVTSESGAAEILTRLGSPTPQYFQVLLKVGIEQDSIKSVEIVAAKPVL